MSKDVGIKLNPFYYAKVLAIVSVTFIFLHVITRIGYYADWGTLITKLTFWFNLDSEGNLPTFFSMFILLNASALLFIISYLEFKWNKSNYTKNWLILAFGFLYMAMDEILKLHEHLDGPIKQLFHLSSSKFFIFSWIIAGFAVVVILAIIFWKFLFSLPIRFRKLFIISALLFTGGALILEFISGAYLGFSETRELVYFLLTAVEEGLEMSGVILFIYSLLEYIKTQYKIEVSE